MKRNIYKEFSNSYLHEFFECIIHGVSGGLYKERIIVEKGKEGKFNKDDIIKFIRFQHGDNDYHNYFSNIDDDLLQKNPHRLAEVFITDIDNYINDYFSNLYPHLKSNIISSLQKIITN